MIGIFYYKISSFKQAILTCVVTGVLILSIGFNPYITSLIRYGSPFYPFGGYSLSGVTPPRALIYSHLLPEYRNLNRIEKLLMSTFSESSNTLSRLKFPFVVNPGEAGVFWNNDIKVGGFGPLFSGALLLALGILVTCGRLILLAPVFLIFMTVIINPEPSWARYVPQFYLIVSFALLTSFIFLERKGFYFQLWKWVLACIVAINLLIIGENSLRRQFGLSHDIKETLSNLHGKKVKVDFDIFTPLSSRLDEFEIDYTPVSHEEALTLENPIPLGAEMTLFEVK